MKKETCCQCRNEMLGNVMKLHWGYSRHQHISSRFSIRKSELWEVKVWTGESTHNLLILKIWNAFCWLIHTLSLAVPVCYNPVFLNYIKLSYKSENSLITCKERVCDSKASQKHWGWQEVIGIFPGPIFLFNLSCLSESILKLFFENIL